MYRPPAKGYPVWDASGKKGAKTQNDGILGAFSIVSESALLLLFLLLLTKGSVEALEEKKGEKVFEEGQPAVSMGVILQGRVCIEDDDAFGFMWLAQTLYPEYTKDIDLKKETKYFFSEFYNYDVSDEEYASFFVHKKK